MAQHHDALGTSDRFCWKYLKNNVFRGYCVKDPSLTHLTPQQRRNAMKTLMDCVKVEQGLLNNLWWNLSMPSKLLKMTETLKETRNLTAASGWVGRRNQPNPSSWFPVHGMA